MKKLVTALFLVVSVLALGVAVYYYLTERAGRADSSRAVATRRLVLAPDGVEMGEDPEEEERRTNRIGALPNEVVLDIETLNLDQDEGEEQILTVRKTDRPEGALALVVADYLPERRAWTRSWEGEILVTKLTTLQVQARDLLGDHSLCIIATGMNDANEQTLSVFRRASSPDREALAYESVASLAGDALVIEEIERSEGYQLGQTNGESLPIHAYRRDRDSPNLLDQIKTSYAWNYREGRYLETGSERIPGALVEKEMAAGLLTGKESDFEAFLEGIWYDASAAPPEGRGRLIVFDRGASTITFYSREAQEVFHWNESHSTRHGLYLGTQNESVPNLRRLIDIELSGAESITLRIFEDLRMKMDVEDRWDGAYRRLPPSSAEPPARKLPAFRLEGSYAGRDLELRFEGQRYALRRGEASERGGFNLYTLGRDTVLELVALKDNGLVASRRSYRASYAETRSDASLVRRLRLAPAVLAITGLELSEEPELLLEQRMGDQ